MIVLFFRLAAEMEENRVDYEKQYWEWWCKDGMPYIYLSISISYIYIRYRYEAALGVVMQCRQSASCLNRAPDALCVH